MTKVIAVLRHAQSAGKQSGQRDYDRILTPEGLAWINKLEKKLSEQGWKPDFILGSAATRVQQTVQPLIDPLGISRTSIQYDAGLYEATPDEWIRTLRKLPDHYKCVLLVGHNPTLSMLASTFAQSSIDLMPGHFISFRFQATHWATLETAGDILLNVHE